MNGKRRVYPDAGEGNSSDLIAELQASSQISLCLSPWRRLHICSCAGSFAWKESASYADWLETQARMWTLTGPIPRFKAAVRLLVGLLDETLKENLQMPSGCHFTAQVAPLPSRIHFDCVVPSPWASAGSWKDPRYLANSFVAWATLFHQCIRADYQWSS